ncbi:MAG: nucleotide sugar dehydrogenase [Gemmatimonadota bacterium]|nr:nucleotide sugar dehydrogenase [Gemmatimonadota bacterium]
MTTGYANDICIVGGAGRVGLPLALTFAGKGLRVIVCDINEASLEMIGEGRMPFEEKGAGDLLANALAEGRLSVSSETSCVADAATVIVTIGTPADELSKPILSTFKSLADDMLPHLSDDQLVVLRSTVSPGTTDWLYDYLRANGRNPKVCFCPERIVQGQAIEEIPLLTQIVSGTTAEAEREAAALFRRISPGIVHLTPIEAEFAKLFSNAYRYIQFATANQFYTIANAAGVDYSRVLEGMKKDYPRARDIPPAGFAAGPCLLKDTMQLAAFASDGFSLGRAAMNVNQGLVNYLVEEIRNRYGDLRRLRIGLLGMAFKADSDDTRFSLSYKLKDILAFRAREVMTTDPHVTTDPNLLPVREVLDRSDLLVLCVPHAAYRRLDLKNKPAVDIWGYLDLDS